MGNILLNQLHPIFWAQPLQWYSGYQINLILEVQPVEKGPLQTKECDKVR